MKMRAVEIPQPTPPREIEITLSEEEAGLLMGIAGAHCGSEQEHESFIENLYNKLSGLRVNSINCLYENIPRIRSRR